MRQSGSVSVTGWAGLARDECRYPLDDPERVGVTDGGNLGPWGCPALVAPAYKGGRIADGDRLLQFFGRTIGDRRQFEDDTVPV
jgi:hypothetical protein